MKVLCISLGCRLCSDRETYVKENRIYTVTDTFQKISPLTQKMIYVYKFKELSGCFETGMFLPLSGVCEFELRAKRNAVND